MNRRLWINLHLWAAALLAPVFLLLATSGGLYLLGIKGETVQTDVPLPSGSTIDLSAASAEQDVRALLASAGVEHDFEYLKGSAKAMVTRPTSRTYYEIKTTPGGVEAIRHEPSLQKRLIELHKGHGPGAFKTFQKVVAAGLIFVVLSGFWLGISAAGLRTTTLIVTGAGAVIAIVLAL